MQHDVEANGGIFDAEEHCGYRTVGAALPEELQDSHLAWQLAGESAYDYFRIIRTCTLLDVQEALAHKLAEQWLRDEPKD